MYTVADWQNQQPEHKYFDYGYYNLSREIGPRIIVNNQTGGATVTGYYNYGGTGPAWTLRGQQEDEYNITPIEVPRGFRTAHPIGWTSGKVK
jgi:hypothetical protein